MMELDLMNLPQGHPHNPVKFTGDSALLSQLWNLALEDAEKNYCIENEHGNTYAAGGYGHRNWVGLTFNRDTSLSGLLALNELYPQEMLTSMKTIRQSRLNLGWTCYPDRVLHGIEGVEVLDMDLDAFKKKFHKASSINKTDDVVWVWAMYDLLKRHNLPKSEWEWTYDTALTCFERFYDPFFDEGDGLYFGQSVFIDVGLSGYPGGWCRYDEEACNKCVWIKAMSLNAVYYKAMLCMSAMAQYLGRENNWADRAENLRQAIRRELRNPDGTYAYFKHKTGELEPRREVLGTAFAVLFDIAQPDEYEAALGRYPVTALGAPLIDPPYDQTSPDRPNQRPYHNNSSWPFADTFLLLAYEKARKQSTADLNLTIMVNAVKNGSLHEWRNMLTRETLGTTAQLWTIAGFLNSCIRAGLTELDRTKAEMA